MNKSPIDWIDLDKFEKEIPEEDWQSLRDVVREVNDEIADDIRQHRQREAADFAAIRNLVVGNEIPYQKLNMIKQIPSRNTPQDEWLANNNGAGCRTFRCPLCKEYVDFQHFNKAVDYNRQLDIIEGLSSSKPLPPFPCSKA